VAAFSLIADEQVAVYTTDDRCVIFSTAQLLPKTTRSTQGVSIVSLKKKAAVKDAVLVSASGIVNQSRYRTRTLPSAGAILKPEDAPEKQIQFEV
jgi:DNA gyrase subunit A